MKRYMYFYPILTFFLFFFLAFPAFAAQSQLSQRWVCLHVEWCIDQAAFNENPSRYVINPICAQQTANGHRVRLTAKSDAKLLPSADTYIVECLATTAGQVCTTGNSKYDDLIYGKDNTEVLKTSDNYEYQGIFKTDGVTSASAPLKSKASGDIDPVEWQSYSKGNSRKFLGLNFFDPNAGDDLSGKGAEQQKSFSFEVQSNAKDCVSIAWDPYGRVFDSQTLEPIPNVSVTLLKKRNNGTFSQLFSSEILGGAIENPYMTNNSGYFSFVVPDGTYKLSVLSQQYDFPNNKTKLNSGYTKAYTDLYPNNTGGEIVQLGTVQHRDIPLDPKNGEGISYLVKLEKYFYNLDKSSNIAVIEGNVSHPLTKIRLYSVKPKSETSQVLTRYKLLKTTQADSYGKFIVEIDQSKFEPTEVFGDLELEKVNLVNQTVTHTFIKTAEAAQSSTNTVRFNPILNQLKGYAYDSKKNILPRANVGVYLSYANKPYYETKTDEKGYYEVASGRLPDSPYNIKYATVIGGTQSTTTSQFIAQNNSYLTSNNIVLSAKAVSQKTTSTKNPFESSVKTTTESGKKQLPLQNDGMKLGQNPVKKTSSSTSYNPLFLVLAILLFLIVGVGVLLGIYLIRKQDQLTNR